MGGTTTKGVDLELDELEGGQAEDAEEKDGKKYRRKDGGRIRKARREEGGREKERELQVRGPKDRPVCRKNNAYSCPLLALLTKR